MSEAGRCPRLWRGLRIGAAVAVLSTVGVGVASAASHRTASSAHVLAAARRPSVTPLTTLPTSGPGIAPRQSPGLDFVAAGLNRNLAGKTATVVTLPKIDIFIENNPDGLPTSDPYLPVGSKVAGGTVTSSGLQIIYAWIISNPTQVAGQPPGSISYGSVHPAGDPDGPSVHVSTLAFGAIPISVDLTLAETVTNGLVDPLVIRNPNYALDSGRGISTYTVSGQLTVALSNVSIDGVPVTLPSTCRTVTPARLVAYAASNLNGGTYGVTSGGTLAGKVVIPAFTGCSASIGGAAPEDIDALLNGTLSGSTNPAYLTQNAVGGLDERSPDDCSAALIIVGCSSPPALPVITSPVPTPAPPPSFFFDPPAYGD